MTRSAYDTLAAATRGLQAYAITDPTNNGEHVARVIIKRAPSGMTTTAWVQVWGHAMQSARVRRDIHDMAPLAVCRAVSKIVAATQRPGTPRPLTGAALHFAEHVLNRPAVDWRTALRPGFTVQHVID